MSSSLTPGRASFPLAVLAADIGSTATGRFAWCEVGLDSKETGGTLPSTLAARVAEHLNQGMAVALGFECPLYIPLQQDELKLTNGRALDGSRPWSAGAGCGSLTTGLVQVAWVLRRIRELLTQPSSAYLDWDAFSAAGSGLLLWEAFVSNKDKSARHDPTAHLNDARGVAREFQRKLPHSTQLAGENPPEAYSLVGAALLRTGWSTDLEVLKQPCLVIKGVPEAA